MREASPWGEQMKALGEFIRAQRQFARMSLRDLAELARVSNPYLSQVERGLHEPSIRVLLAIAEALDIPEDELLDRLRKREPSSGEDAEAGAQARTEAAIRADPLLSAEEKEALLSVYRTYLSSHGEPTKRTGGGRRAKGAAASGGARAQGGRSGEDRGDDRS